MEIKEFIDEFNENVKLKNDTILEKIGIQYKEVYYNELLAFYLNPNEKHGYGDKILKVLLKSANIKGRLDLTNLKFEKPNYFETESRKQIDICAHNDSFGLIIENKIHADLDNPFEEYVKEIKSLNEKNFRILLHIIDYEEEKLEKAKKNGFILVHYEDFIKNIRELNLNCENKWQILFEDMIDTLDSICSLKIDADGMKWIEKNSENIVNCHKKLMKIKDKKYENEEYEKFKIVTDYLSKSISKKVVNINNKNIELVKKNIELGKNNIIIRGSKPYDRNKDIFYYISIIDIFIGKIRVALDNALGLNGWCINLNIASKVKNPQNYKSIIIDKLKNAGIDINNHPKNPYVGETHINLFDLGGDVSMEEILEINRRVIDALLK